MGPIDALWHVLNFLRRRPSRRRCWRSGGRFWTKIPKPRRRPVIVCYFFAVGTAVLAAGLILLGHDGRMLTYAALVLAQGSALALVWRR